MTSALLIDLDGVVYQNNRLIDGALDALAWFHERQVPYLFVTNTTSRSRATLVKRFSGFGFDVDIDELMTPIVAAREYLASHSMRRLVSFVSDDASVDFDGFDQLPDTTTDPVDAVLIGDLGDAWDYARLNAAFRLLMQTPQPALIALGMSRYWRGPRGLQLDVAPFVRALECAAGCEAVVVGKPARAFFEAALSRLQAPAAEVYMIGDDIHSDVGAAQDCGIHGIQVRTGKFRETDLDGDIRPDTMLDSLADLPDWWLKTAGRN